MTDASAAAEAALCQVFAEVLGVDRVRPQDGFFEVGGDSVLALRVVARAREAGLAFTVRSLFDYQTPEMLAAVAGSLADSPGVSSAAAAADSPLLTVPVGDFEDFEDFEETGVGPQADDAEAGWETVT
jgi:aryl carrier-like protein